MEEPSDDELSVKSDDRLSFKSDDSSASNRVKYLYSHGGKILPRPADGKLRYVGGETRVMATNRGISFSELMAKICEVVGSSVVLKCQLPGEDLDALVSIKSDEDLDNVLEEYGRLQARTGSSKVRAFLFPKPASPLTPPVAAALMAARGRNVGHDCDERGSTGSCFDAGSNPRGCCYPKHCRSCDSEPRGPHLRQPEIVSVSGRPPRSPVHPDGQFNSPFRYATQIHDGPPRHNSAGRSVSTSYVDHGEVGRAFRQQKSNSNCQYMFPGYPTQKSTKVPYQYIMHDPYYGGGSLEGFHAQQRFLVQH